MPQGRPMPGEIYRHFKNKTYQILAVARHSETRELYVVYQALYGDYQTYVRPYDMFISQVDHEKYPEVEQEYRFAYIASPAETSCQPEDMASAGDSTKAMTQDQKVLAKKAAGQPERPVAKEPEVDAELQGVNPHFLDFLDADTYGRKYDIVTEMEEELDDHLINQMAASIDEIIEDGRLEDRILQLEACLRTKARYELNRAR